MHAVFALVWIASYRVDAAVDVSLVPRSAQKSHYKAVFELTHKRLWAQLRDILVGNIAVK